MKYHAVPSDEIFHSRRRSPQLHRSVVCPGDFPVRRIPADQGPGRRPRRPPAGPAKPQELLQEIEAFQKETRRLGEDQELQLRLGYLNNYCGSELYETIAAFSSLYPEVTIHIFNGTHEDLYEQLRSKKADMVLNDQRRAFSDTYENDIVTTGVLYAEISRQNPLSQEDHLSLEALRRIPCILVASAEQEQAEGAYYADTLGFAENFLFARTLEDARLLVASNRGYLPLETFNTTAPSGTASVRLPLYKEGKPLLRHYCLFWRKDNSTYYVEEFSKLLHERVQPAQTINK